MALRTIAMCAGFGGFELGARLAGVDPRVVLYVEREAFAVAHLVAAMEAGALDEAPVWSDAATFDGNPWRGAVDCILAGIPCQGYSAAGAQRAGDDPRDLVGHLGRIVGECAPSVVFVENVPGFVTKGGYRRLGELLAPVGYRLEEPVLCRASDVGAPHKRERVFIMAHSIHCSVRDLQQPTPGPGSETQPRHDGASVAVGHRREGERGGRLHDGAFGHDADGCDGAGAVGYAARHGQRWGGLFQGRPEGSTRGSGGDVVDSKGYGRREGWPETVMECWRDAFTGASNGCLFWPPDPEDAAGWEQWRAAGGSEPCVRRGDDGPPARVDRLRLLGNGIVPQQAALAIRVLLERAEEQMMAEKASSEARRRKRQEDDIARRMGPRTWGEPEE